MNLPMITPFYLKNFTIILLFSITQAIQAQGIKGKVVDEEGEPLPFASIGVQGSSTGTTANVEGQYQLTLSPGSYHIVVVYLGYSQLDTTIVVSSGFKNFTAVMTPESIALPEAVVSGDNEDPAYTIMRRAIAKAKYHSMQIDEYNAMVYMKGSGRILKTPWILRKKINKALAEEGIDSTTAFTQESVSKLHYTRPDQYRDTVISVRTIGNDNNTSPMEFVYSSFYEPQVVNGISPLAPDAFNHYRFEYLGYVQVGDQTINKIKVIPRGKGDNVFEGVIYIVDQAWSIYSLDLTTYIWGIKFGMQQRFEQAKPDVWVPVHEVYDVNGNVFGFAFEYRYFAQVKDYKIKLNPDLEVPVLVLDSKKDKEEAKVSDAKHKKSSFESGLGELNPNEELSTKQLRKMMKEYEEKEIEALPENDTLSIASSTQVIDSSAYKQDSSYWNSIRPMPLTKYEVKNYAVQDSIAKIPPDPNAKSDEEEEGQDSISLTMSDEGFEAEVKRRIEFKPLHLVTGGRYDLSDQLYFKLKAPLQTVNFNTVDGFHLAYDLELGSKSKKNVNWSFGPLIRYNISREDIDYEGKLNVYGKKWSVKLAGGNQVQQFSTDHPIALYWNAAYTLFGNLNYLKEYEQQFYSLTYEQKIGKAVGFKLNGFYAERTHLENNSDLVFFDSKRTLYTSNDPDHIEAIPGDLDDHTALITDLSVWTKPFWKYEIRRGTKRKDYSDSPMLTVNYKKGWNEDYDPFDLVSANFVYRMLIGAGSTWSMNLGAGKFIGDDRPRYFADYAHLPGHRLIWSFSDPVHSFRNLDYYTYSTREEYAYALFNYQFRRLALTQIHDIRRSGIRENVIFNTLFSPTAQQYAEVGYAVNYIFRVLRVEFVSSWQDFTYKDFAFRIGVATDFKSIFGGL